eukprot:gene37350-46086_t
MIRLDSSIISLAFHPSGSYIAVASGAIVEVWKWADKNCLGHNVTGNIAGRTYRYRAVQHMRNIRAVIFHPKGEYLFIAAPDSPKLPNETLTHCRLFALKFFSLLDVSTCTDPFELYTQKCILPKVHLYSDGGLDISPDGEFLFTCAQLERNVHTITSTTYSKAALYDSYALSPMSHRERLDHDFNFDPNHLHGRHDFESDQLSTTDTIDSNERDNRENENEANDSIFQTVESPVRELRKIPGLRFADYRAPPQLPDEEVNGVHDAHHIQQTNVDMNMGDDNE